MGDFTTKKRFILALLALLLAMDGALAFHNSRLSVKEVNPDARLKAESLKVALVRADIERANKIKARLPEVQKYFDQFETTLPPAGKGYSEVSQEVGENCARYACAGAGPEIQGKGSFRSQCGRNRS